MKTILKYKAEIIFATVAVLILATALVVAVKTPIDEELGATIRVLPLTTATTSPFDAITVRSAGQDIYVPYSNVTSSIMSADTYCINNTTPDCISVWPVGGASSFPAQLGQIGDVSTTTLALGSIIMWDGTNSWDSVATSSLGIIAAGDGVSNWGLGITYGESVLTPTSTIPLWAKDTIYASSTLFVDGTSTLTIALIDEIKLSQSYTPVEEVEGVMWWNSTDHTLNISTGLGATLQVGQEEYIIIYNGTGSEISNGSAVYPTGGVTGGRPDVALANATDHTKISQLVLITTMDIPDASEGIATTFGQVRNMDTDAFSVGDILWLDTTDGQLTNARPNFPNYSMGVGRVLTSDATTGSIQANSLSSIYDTVDNFWNGTFRENFNFLVSSDGATITGTLSPSNGNDDMTMLFSDGFTMLDTNPAITIELTAGTDANPQYNYIYIPVDTKVLTKSTSAFPSTEFIFVAKILLQSATATADYDALRNQNINNEIQHTTSDIGFLHNLAETVRYGIGAKWRSGAEGSVTIDATPSPDEVWISTTGGVIRQMHDQTWPATATGTNMFIVNDPVASYATTTNLNTALLDASGDSLADTSYSVVVWGAANKTGETSQIMVNLPTCSYNKNFPQQAVDDASACTVYTIPTDFQGVGFLIARFTFVLTGSTSWTLNSTEDLRGFIPNTTAGGGGTGGGVSTFLGLTDTPSAYTGLATYIPRINAGETALEFTNSPTFLSVTTTNFGINSDTFTDLTGQALSVTNGVLNAEVQTSDLHDAVTLAGTPNYLTLAGQVITLTVLDINDDTDLTVASPLALSAGAEITIDVSGTWTGVATTATSAASEPTNCAAGSYPLGVDTSWDVESCTDASTEIDSIVATHTADNDAHQALVTITGEDYLTLSTQAITMVAINPDNLASADFGDFTCNGTTCSLDANTVDGNEIDLTANYTWTGGHNFGGATLEIPNGASPTVDAAGEIAVDTTSDQLVYYGAAKYVVTGYDYSTFTYITSTAWTGAGVIPLGTAYVAETWSSVQCFTDTGTLNVFFSDGTNDTNTLSASTTVGTVGLSANNTFTAGEKRYLEYNTPASTPTELSCTVQRAITAD